MRVLVTCPPMLGIMDELTPVFRENGITVHCPDVIQTLTISELMELVPRVDGWIIGDDPAVREVLEAGIRGRLKAAVKWGVGIDNVDIPAARELGLRISHTPNMFGREVADLAISYVVALARQTHVIDRGVRTGFWPKPRGISLANKTVALVGYGDVGRQTARRLVACDMKVVVYDPYANRTEREEKVTFAQWPKRLEECDFVVLTCALTSETRHLLNKDTLALVKSGIRIINLARGALIDECALVAALQTRQVHSAALDVFEEEPLPQASALRSYDQCIFGSHNASNTEEGARRTSYRAMEILLEFLGVRV